MKDKWVTQAEVADRLASVQQLARLVCQCGRGKQRGMAVCFKCWRLLPEDVRWALYQPVGKGYEAAYEKACGLLKDAPHRAAPATEGAA